VPESRLVMPTNPGAMLRGALGLALKRGVCVKPSGELCGKRCELPDVCPYAFVVESPTPSDAEVLSASQEVPPPYLLEPPLVPPHVLEAGALLPFQLVLFGSAIRYFPYLLAACRAMGQEGLGPARVRCRLAAGVYAGPDGEEIPLFDGVSQRVLGSQPPAPTVSDWATAPKSEMSQSTLRFVTPTRLKHADRYVEGPPPFHVVVRSLLRRVSSLSYFYGGERWEIDYRGWIERAEAVQITQASVHYVDWERYSTRQGRSMSLGGIVGTVTYTGEVGPFLPLLRLGELVHVGKAAVFGNGRFEVVREG
jgi:hypothetical protein